MKTKTTLSKQPNGLRVRLLFFLTLTASFMGYSQTITKDAGSSISNTVCPVTKTSYTIGSLGIYSSCSILWTATNGKIEGRDNYRTVNVIWDDTRGAAPTLKCTLSGCTTSDGKALVGKDVTFTDDKLILSVKDQSWGIMRKVIHSYA